MLYFYVSNNSGILSRHFSTLSRHKELKIAEKLCRVIRKLCHNTKFRVSNGRQDNFVATEKFYVVTKKFKEEKNCKMNVAT